MRLNLRRPLSLGQRLIILVAALALEGYEVTEASNGAEALAMLPTVDPEAIVLDLWMPVMDGWAFRREQREDPAIAAIPVVVLSGVEADHVQDLGAAAAFHKPVSFPDVVGALRRLCDLDP